MTKYTIYLGLNDKDAKTQLIRTADAYSIISGMFEAATITRAIGIYTHEDGTKIQEKTLKIEYLDFNGDFDLQKTSKELKRIFNQESVAVRVERDIESYLM